MSCVAGSVRVMPHWICGVSMRAVSIENGSGGSSPGCISTADQSMVLPSSRGGVPVLSRPSAKPIRSSVSDSPTAGASPTRPAGVCVSPTWIRPRRNVPVVSTTAPHDSSRPSLSRTPVTLSAAISRSSASPSTTVRFAVSRIARCIAGGIKLAVGLRARPAHGRTLAAIEHAELDAALVGDAAHQPVERIDLAHQMALAEPADRRIAGHRPDGREAVRDQRGARAHARGRGRGLAAGVAAANHDDIEGGHGIHPQGLYPKCRTRNKISMRFAAIVAPANRIWARCFT